MGESQEPTAAILTLAHFIRVGAAESEADRKYAHDHVAEEYEVWLGYVTGEGEPVSPLKAEEETDAPA